MHNIALRHAFSVFFRMVLFGVLTALVLLIAAPVYAATITVTNILDGGSGSLRQAALDATPGETIVFDSAVFSTPLTITLTSGQIVINKSLVIEIGRAHV